MSLKIGKNLQKYSTVETDGSIIFNKTFPNYYSWSRNTTRPEMIDIVQELVEFLKEVESSNTYVEIIPGTNPLMRDRSIGTIHSLHGVITRLNNIVSDLNNNNVYTIDLENRIGKYTKLEIKFDKKHAAGFFPFGKVKFLDGYTGGPVYVNEKSIQKKEIILKDKFDNELKEGSFICFATSTSRQQGIAKFGKITSIKNENLFYAKNIKLSEKDRVSEYVLRYPEDVILMNDELMNNITMARLSI